MRALLFPTCLADQFYAEAVADSVRVLRRLGLDVAVPDSAVCCGQPALNSGYEAAAKTVAAQTVRALAEGAAVVVPSGSCASMIRTVFPRLLRGSPDEEAATDVASRTWELSQFIVERLGTTEVGQGLVGRRIALHHGCHALRELGVREQPLTLLVAGGAEVVPWSADEECCGFGGTFSTKLPHVSVGMADRKLDSLPPCDTVTSTDAGCLMQLSGRSRFRGDAVTFRHVASLIWEAMRGPG